MDNISKQNKGNNVELDLYYYGNQVCNPGHFWGPAIKEHYKIHYIHSGKGIFCVRNKTYELGEGQGFLICPNSISYYKADEKEPWTYSWVAFDGAHVEEYLLRANLSIDQPIFTYNKDSQMENCLEQLIRISDKDISKDLKLKSLLYLFLATIIEGTKENQINRKYTKSHDYYIQKVVEFIRVNYSRKISISEVAHFISLDRKYISAIFKDSLGITLQDYLIKYRFDKACELMNNQALSIGDISRSVGYEDPLVFSRMFKRVKGISPSQYRSNI